MVPIVWLRATEGATRAHVSPRGCTQAHLDWWDLSGVGGPAQVHGCHRAGSGRDRAQTRCI